MCEPGYGTDENGPKISLTVKDNVSSKQHSEQAN